MSQFQPLKEALEMYFEQGKLLFFSVWDHPEQEFKVLNYSTLVFWSFLLLWCLIPKWGKTCRFAVKLYAMLVSAFYLIKFLKTFDFEKEFDLFDFAVVCQSFTNPKVVIVGWAHYIVFDIMVAVSMVQEITKYGLLTRLCFVPVLPVICLFGPIGLIFAFAVLWAASKLRSHEIKKDKVE
jgi:hypothetical protein